MSRSFTLPVVAVSLLVVEASGVVEFSSVVGLSVVAAEVESQKHQGEDVP